MAKKKYIAHEYGVAKGGKNLRDDMPRGRVGRIFSTSFFVFAIVISFSLIAFTIVFFYSAVNGPSMMMELNPRYTVVGDTDAVIVNRHRTPERGDVIVTRFYNPDGRQELFVKRLIAKGGDSLYFQRHALTQQTAGGRSFWYEIHLNGIPLDESAYLDPDIGQNVNYSQIWRYLNGFRHESRYADFIHHNEERNRWEIVIPHGYVFYIGDNRGGSGTTDELRRMSRDSTFFGPQPAEWVMGVVTDVIGEGDGLFGFIIGYFWNTFVHVITFRWIWG
ncbi:MAG: S26 family signal peptidase [Firmicutes bacterium]|nr:S26 family signal peptidase [Bacillota bacterium]